MVKNRIIFSASRVSPNPDEIDYWVDLVDNPYGGSIKYYNGTEWVRLAASGGIPDLSNYYNKEQVNQMLNTKASVDSVESKVDDEEVKDVIKDIDFRTSDSNSVSMILLKYDGNTESVTVPVASMSTAGIVTSKDFQDFVKQHQLQELHTEMIDLLADIRSKYQKKLIAGLNIYIDQDTNVISASGDLSVQWDKILNKPDFKPVATSGDYNDLTNKLTAGKDVNISDSNVITIDIDSDELKTDLSNLDTKITNEAATARAAEKANADAITKEISDRTNAIKVETDRATAAEKKLQDNLDAGVTSLENAIATEQNRAESVESTISTNLQNEINRSTQQDTAHTTAINKEIQDRKDAITTEVNDRNAAIKVESDRAKTAEEALDNRIDDHTTAVTAALALKADKSDTYTKSQVDAKLSGAYKVKGSSTFEALPTTNNVIGDVYNITNEFTLNGDHFDAGTNVVWTEDGWDPLSGSFDTTAIEDSIQEVADTVSQEIIDRTASDTALNNSITAVSTRVSTTESKLNTIQGDENTTGSINKALKDAKSYTDTSVTTEKTRAEAVEQQLTADLASEVTRAKAAESANTTAIQNEESRATGIESALRTDVNNLSNSKVDKVTGKGLSTNDYTTTEKNKLAGIAAGAEVNVQSDWNEATTTSDAYIKNKPTNATSSTSGFMSSTDKAKLDGIEAKANNYVLPKATTTTLGGIIVGDRLSIDANGKLTATYVYTLPTATGSVLGGVKIGSNITNTSGTISLTKANVTAALGVDPTTTYVNKAGDTMTGTLTQTKGDLITNGYLFASNGLNRRVLVGGGGSNYAIIEVRSQDDATINNIVMYDDRTEFKKQISSTVVTGTAPIQVSSRSLCTNLNADLLDHRQADSFSDKMAQNQIQASTTDNIYYKLLNITKNSATYDTLYLKYEIISRVNSATFYSNDYDTCCGRLEIISNYSPNGATYSVRCNGNYDGKGRLHAFVNGDELQIWYVGYQWENIHTLSKTKRNHAHFIINEVIALDSQLPTYSQIEIESTTEDDWYGVSWSETSSNPDCTRIGNMDMHRTLPIQNAMKPFAFNQQDSTFKDRYIPMKENFTESLYAHSSNGQANQVSDVVNIMIKIPEFWYTDDYVADSKTHNLKICPHSKPGWNHHKEAFVSAYELYNLSGRAISTRGKIPTVSFNRTDGRTWARANGFDGESKWNLYTYEEHRAICHLFLVEYATRHSQKAVNTVLTPDGFRQGGLGSGCTTGMVNGAYSFIPTGTSDALGSGSGEVTWTASDGTTTRKCNRYRGIENPFGHIWKHCDDVISIYDGYNRTWYKCEKPSWFSTNKNTYYKSLRSNGVVTGYKTEITATPTCDFFAAACSGGSETTYWCDYNWDNTDGSEHCLLIGGGSDNGGTAGLFLLHSYNGVGYSSSIVGSRLVYLPWAE